MRARWTVALLGALTLGCFESSTLGERCERTGDCEAPLVCRLETCRAECVTSTDCAAGLTCVVVDGEGACLLREETDCALPSDCPAPLVCDDGRCTNECADDRDCPAGASCVAGGCSETGLERCLDDSDCPSPEVCGPDRRCRPACVDDCAPGETCRDGDCQPTDAGA
ncbi:MAG TPA: hypothetical protein RMH99_07705 [Sandaracinaceae bacterium LLY-WYZ-13_1]|nr:hypothetical protein [Sandaracinaceae bacterium LLY-WYZ-13_1]